jgi:hypothetical protein
MHSFLGIPIYAYLPLVLVPYGLYWYAVRRWVYPYSKRIIDAYQADMPFGAPAYMYPQTGLAISGAGVLFFFLALVAGGISHWKPIPDCSKTLVMSSDPNVSPHVEYRGTDHPEECTK